MNGANWSYAVKGRFWGKRWVGSGHVHESKQLKKRAFRSREKQILHKALLEENWDELDFTPHCPYTDWDVW